MNRCEHGMATNEICEDCIYEELMQYKQQAMALASALEKAEHFLNNDIACLPCESRQRDLPEETWEYAMFIRDTLCEALAKFREFREGEK